MKLDKNEAGKHIPIMLKECTEGLDIKPSDIIVDCTVNRGGHAKEFVKKLGKGGVLICIDLDAKALKEAEENINLELTSANILKDSKPKIFYVNNNFSNLEAILKELNIEKVDKIFADLGISSQEIDISGRGFSFMRDEPLLMTFKVEEGITEDDTTARDVVNYWGEESIANILFNFADERYSRRIAKGIVEARKVKSINTTFELVEIIKASTPFAYHKLKTNPATRTFQALRMAVNDEIGAVIKLLNSISGILSENGRFVVLTFHSTEDRIVKHTARDLGLKQVNKKAIIAEREEVRENVRSRSAKLRIYEKNK
jgi:16S rRNA (cytosine1402-N4)-methyltransferase